MVAQGYGEGNLAVGDDPKDLAEPFLGRTAEDDVSRVYHQVGFLYVEHLCHVLIGPFAPGVSVDDVGVGDLEHLELAVGVVLEIPGHTRTLVGGRVLEVVRGAVPGGLRGCIDAR